MILGRDIQTGQFVSISQIARFRGLYAIANTGGGKTTMMVNMALQDIEKGVGVCFFDTHGGAIREILKKLPSHREQDVIYLDLLDKTHVFGLNLLACQNPNDKQEVSRVMSAVTGIFAKLL